MAVSTLYLSRLLGFVLLIAAILMLVDKETMIAAATALGQDRTAILALGVVRVVAGAGIVLIHNIWTRGFLPLVVTSCGWLLLLRGVALLFLPSEVFTALVASAHVPEFYYLYAAIPLVFGVYLSLNGFMASASLPEPRNPTRSA